MPNRNDPNHEFEPKLSREQVELLQEQCRDLLEDEDDSNGSGSADRDSGAAQ